MQVLFKGSANLIWVKYGAQLLPVCLDLINPNCVIVLDDKGNSVQEPHCQIIVFRLIQPSQRLAETEQLSITTTAEYKGIKLQVMEGKY